MFAQLYIVPFTSTLILAKDMQDVKTVTDKKCTYICDIKYKKQVYVDGKRIRLKNDYMGNTLVTASQAIKEELQCSF